ncbi:TetR/AcrR family transcriptional regulator [Massilia pinisoli]|uniref:TetR/AcrR family transcriptional regulator n=1 Tax=Massilia pinisoli TaxID=1772194 RepID=A0ABT1ZZU0_9BURK|nr:TetR/AcrR family transcriptional regulator [Massilia pinisoli]MCS0585453.1 TetR/AcrR family transcriptional regulator [Massilia pinisoli]
MTASGKQRARAPRIRKPADVARRRLRPQGMRTRDAIVRTARALLLECGGLEFTLRAIAQRAGITVSNLQYYFPTRLAVLRAVLEPVIDGYMRDLRGTVDGGAAPRATLDALVVRALHDARDLENAALWCHFLALVAIDDPSAPLLDEWHGALSHEMAVLVGAVNPAFSYPESLEIAILIIAIVDGVTVRTGTGMRACASPDALDASFLAAVDGLLRGTLRAGPRALVTLS